MSISFITLGARLPWIYPLTVELGRFGPSFAIDICASLSFFGSSFRWPYDDSERLTRREIWSYPSAFNRFFQPILNNLLRRRLNRKVHTLKRETGDDPFVIVTDPRHVRILKDIKSEKLIYLNYDDYTAGNDGRNGSLATKEETLVSYSGTVLCSSALQTRRFSLQYPKKRERIFHFPHGVTDSFINPYPDRKPEPNTICCVGRMSYRYDWKLIYEVVTALSDVRFLFSGEVRSNKSSTEKDTWKKYLYAVLKLPNVSYRSGESHTDSATLYWQSVSNWLPYNPAIQFVKASCPLKIVDGLASGRPIISSDIPECRLYPEWIKIFNTADQAISIIRESLTPKDFKTEKTRLLAQIEFAKANNWMHRAGSLLKILGGPFLGSCRRQKL